MKTKNAIVFALLLLSVSNVSAQRKYLTNVEYSHNDGVGFNIGYVNQQFQVQYGNYSSFTDGIWEKPNGRLHGMSLGIMTQGHWDWGIGILWGTNLEFYLSTNNPTGTSTEATVTEAYDTFLELAAQMPLHIALKLPVSKNFALGFHTGPSATVTCFSRYFDTRGYFENWNPVGTIFKLYNLTYDIAVYTEIKDRRIDVQWSTGLINQQSSSEWDKMTRNKLFISLTSFF